MLFFSSERAQLPLRSTGSLLNRPPAVIATIGPNIPNVLKIPVENARKTKNMELCVRLLSELSVQKTSFTRVYSICDNQSTMSTKIR